MVTDHATFAIDDRGLLLTELARGSTLQWVAENTCAAFRVAEQVRA